MTRNFVSFIRLVVFVVVVSFGTLMLAGCNNPAAPTPPGGGSGGQGVQMDPLPPGSPAPTEVPSGPVQMEYVGTGEPFPATVEILYLSPEPGSRVIRGVTQNCAQFPNTCFQRKLKVCVDPSLRFPGSQGPVNLYLTNERGVKGDGHLGPGNLVSGPDANGCWVFDGTMQGMDNAFNPFPSRADCCDWLNVFIHRRVYRIGENPPDTEDEGTHAFAAFYLAYNE